MKKHLLCYATLCSAFFSFAQISEGGLPTTFSKVIVGEVSEFQNDYQIVELNKPDMVQVKQEDLENGEKGKPYRVAIETPVDLSIQNSGTWKELANGDRIWRLGIKMSGANALSLYFGDHVLIPEGGKLHAYNSSHSQYVGAYTSNTPTFKSMELIQGELITLEYLMPANSTVLPQININNVAYYYRGFTDRISVFEKGHSVENQVRAHQSCEVDVACSEITGWETQRDAVVQYSFSSVGGTFVCSGAMVNNTNNDCTPYFLTANHCGEPTNNASIANHNFYFNYQRPTCVVGNTAQYNGAQSQTMSGGTLKASSELGNQTAGVNQVSGTDFVLIQMSTDVPASYNAYYAGWSRVGGGSPSGVGIHHPAGDEKKISTYTSSLASATYNGGWNNAHWEVQWSATANGHGVTEGGSSGSPIFNNSGLIIGYLSGGSSFCTATSDTDLYGKFRKGWNGEGNNNNQQLEHWLDPAGSNTLSLNGTYAPCSPTTPVADFEASATSISPANTVTFTDLSSNSPTSWTWAISPATGWSFANGTNANSQNPQITFNDLGQYSVTLTATNATGSDDEVKNNYIEVVTTPDPCSATSTHSCGANDEYIDKITLGTIDNASSCSNYSDFTSQSTDLTQGEDYNIIFSSAVGATSGTAYSGNELAAWIDFNNDGDFEDIGERVAYILVSGAWNSSVNFTVPSNTVVGEVKMRVRISYEPIDGAISPCGTTTSGEVEDYSIILVAAPTVLAPVAEFVADQTVAVEGTTINFTDQSTNTPTNWTWSVVPNAGWAFTGGTNSNSQNPKINFTAAGDYSISLNAANVGGNDDESKTDYISIGTDGIGENDEGSISVFPNPTNNVITVILPSSQSNLVELRDVTGRLIASKLNMDGFIQFDLRNQSTGVYFVVVKSDARSVTKKVIRL